MHAPQKVTEMIVLEIAIGEMAEKLGINPIFFSIKNDTQESSESLEMPPPPTS